MPGVEAPKGWKKFISRKSNIMEFVGSYPVKTLDSFFDLTGQCSWPRCLPKKLQSGRNRREIAGVEKNLLSHDVSACRFCCPGEDFM